MTLPERSDIFGLESAIPLAAGWTPLEAVAVIKCLDEEGEVRLFMAATKLTPWESIGMLIAASDMQRYSLTAAGLEDQDE